MHFCMIECNLDVTDLSIFVMHDMQYIILHVWVQNKLNICAGKHKWTTNICKSQMNNKNPKIQNNDKSSFSFKSFKYLKYIFI
jgi:hypothetical protein